MILNRKTIGRCVVVCGATLTFLASALISARDSRAGAALPQDPVKEAAKDAVKEVQKEAVKEEVAKEALTPAEAREALRRQQVEKLKVQLRQQQVVVEPVQGKVAEQVQVKMEAVPAKVAFPQGQVQNVNANVEAQAKAQQANIEAMAMRILPTYKPMLEAEIRFLTTTSEPSPTQRREIAIEGAKALRQAARTNAEIRYGINRNANNLMPDPRKQFREAMEVAAKAKLSPDQFARYKKEVDARDKNRREAEVLSLVATLDKLLNLSPDQRDKLSVHFREHWDETNYPTLDTATMYVGYYPMIQNIQLFAILDEYQKNIWSSATKISYGTIRNYNVNNGQVNNPNNAIEDEDVKAALAEEAKK